MRRSVRVIPGLHTHARCASVLTDALQVDGPSWLSYSGEIRIDPSVRIGGFKASGLWVKVRAPPSIRRDKAPILTVTFVGLHRIYDKPARFAEGAHRRRSHRDSPTPRY